MIISTIHQVPGKQVAKILGIARGNTVRARWFGRDFAAGLKSMVGGEIVSYTEMLSKVRDDAIERNGSGWGKNGCRRYFRSIYNLFSCCWRCSRASSVWDCCKIEIIY